MKLRDAEPKEETAISEDTFKESDAITEETSVELTAEQIQAWKLEHGKVYKNIVDGHVYIWRRVKRSEYVSAMSYKSEEAPEENYYIRQNILARAVTLYPDADTMLERVEEYAGLAGEIADRAIYKSGFEASETEEL